MSDHEEESDAPSGPATPRPPAATDPTVVRAAIHPASGIARVGNSPDGYFVGPEVVEPRPEDTGYYRDEAGGKLAPLVNLG
jgi:hypothetical protein